MSSPFPFSGNFLFSSWSRFVFSVSEPSGPPVNFLLTLLAAPAPVALRRGGRGAGEGRGAEATPCVAAAAPCAAGRPRAGAPAACAAPACAVVAEDLPLRALLPHGGRRGLADAAGKWTWRSVNQ